MNARLLILWKDGTTVVTPHMRSLQAKPSELDKQLYFLVAEGVTGKLFCVTGELFYFDCVVNFKVID